MTFLREFADAAHHGKEEDILFQAMAEGGFPAEDGPIGVMLRDHDEGRALVGILDEARGRTRRGAKRTGGGSARPPTGSRTSCAASIQKEDGILYPMARHHLAPEAFERVGEDCARFEALRERNGIALRMQALGEELAGRCA